MKKTHKKKPLSEAKRKALLEEKQLFREIYYGETLNYIYEGSWLSGLAADFGSTLKGVARIFGVGLRSAVVGTWKNIRVGLERLRLMRVQRLAQENMALLELKSDEIPPDTLQRFNRAFKQAVQDQYKSLQDARNSRESFRKSIDTQYEQIMRPVFDELLQGPNAAAVFFANPALYLTALGARVFTTNVPLGSFANKDIAGAVDLLAPVLRQNTRQQDEILNALKTGFSAEKIFDSVQPNESLKGARRKGVVLFGSLNENLTPEERNEIKGRMQSMSEEELQQVFEDANIYSWQDFFDALFEQNPELEGVVEESRQFIREQTDILESAIAEIGEDINLCKAVIASTTLDELDEIMRDAGESEVFNELNEFVLEEISNPQKAQALIDELDIKDSEPEVVAKAARRVLFQRIKSKLDNVMHESIAGLERGILSIPSPSLPPPSQKEDWLMLEATEEGKAFKATLEAFIENSESL